MLHLGTLELGTVPRVVMALRDGVSTDVLRSAVSAGVDAFELRIDLFSSHAQEFVLQEVKRYAIGVPLLGTIRGAAEGGGWKTGEPARLHLYSQILPLVDAVDVELDADDVVPEVVLQARTQGKLVLGSHHNFLTTPSMEQLNALAERSQELGVDVLKVAAHCEHPEDLLRLALFTRSAAPKPVVIIGMGDVGSVSRVLFPAFGSLLTYTFYGEASAPGQLNWIDTLKYLDAFYPLRTQQPRGE